MARNTKSSSLSSLAGRDALPLLLLLTLTLLLLLPETSSSVVHPTSRWQRNQKRILRSTSTRYLEDDTDPDLYSELYQPIAATYLPVWFDRITGYDGQTYQDALAFCESNVGDGYGLCPYEAVCPGGAGNVPLGGYRDDDGNKGNDDNDDFGSWAPIASESGNEWVQVAESADDYQVCTTWGEAAGSSIGPLWGLTGEGSEEFTRSVMCCLVEDSEINVGEVILQEEGDGGGTGEDDAVDMEESDSTPIATTMTTTAAATTITKTDGESSVVDDPLLPQLGYVTQTWQISQGYPEGIAYDKTNRRLLLSSLVSGTIVALDVDDDMSRRNVYVPNTVTPGSGMGLKVYDRGEDEGPLVYATLTNFEAMDQGGLAMYELDMTDDTIAFMNDAVDTSPYYMSCLDGDTMCGMANDVVVTEEGVAYVTDSRNGRVFVVEDGVMKLISDDPLLQSEDASFPYGANGLVYDERGFLVVGNTQMASLVRVDLLTGEVASIPITGEIGNVDGMLMHPDGRLLVITGTTIYVLRDEENEWKSARVEGVVNVDYSDAGESATTATFGDDSNDLFVTFVRFSDLFGGELSQEPALLARVLLEEIIPDGNIDEAINDSTVAPVNDTTTTPATPATDTPVASIAATVEATISSEASSISAKSSKAEEKSAKSSSGNLISKSSKSSTVDMNTPTHSSMSMMQENYSKSGKVTYHNHMSMRVSTTTKSGKAFTAKTGKAEYDVEATETTTTTTAVPELATAKSEKAFHSENFMISKAAKTESSKSSKVFSVGHVHDATTPTPPSNNEISSKAAKTGAIVEGTSAKQSSKAADGGNMSMGNFESMKSHELSGKSSSDKLAKTSKYRLFKTELVRENSLFM